MAVSVLQRPKGFILDTDNPVSAFAINSSGTVRITVSGSHGLTTNDSVYVKAPIEDYNGFWFVNVINSNTFELRRYVGATSQSYINQTSLTYYKYVTEHGWSCVHLPIMYKLSNTLWPTNSADTARTVSSLVDSNGYCSITASGDIKATGSAAKLEFVKISGASDSSYNGVYQIITYSSDTSFVIDLAYSAAADTAITGATIQYYYNNYHVNVRIYGGLDTSHPYTTTKPYELLAEVQYTPDSNGQVIFSINEILKEHIQCRNNLLLGTLPVNLDFFTQFYIEYAESYDDSDGTTVSTFTSSYTSDKSSFEGYAVNAKLPFKNVHSGFLSDYLMVSDSSKFLTLFDVPILFVTDEAYFDISFILPDVLNQGVSLVKKYYHDDNLLAEDIQGFTSSDNIGVLRIDLSDESIDCEPNATLVTDLSTIGGWSNEGVEDRQWLIPTYELKSKRYRWALSATAEQGGLISISVTVDQLNVPGTIKVYLIQTGGDQEIDFGSAVEGVMTEENVSIDEDTDFIELEFTAANDSDANTDVSFYISNIEVSDYVASTGYVTNPGFTGSLTPWANQAIDPADIPQFDDFEGPFDNGQKNWSYSSNKASLVLTVDSFNEASGIDNDDFASSLGDWTNITYTIGANNGSTWGHTASNGGSAEVSIGPTDTHSRYLSYTITDFSTDVITGDFSVRITYLATGIAGTSAVARIWIYQDNGVDPPFISQVGSDIPLVINGVSQTANVSGSIPEGVEQHIRISIHKSSGAILFDLQTFILRIGEVDFSKFLAQDLSSSMIPAGDFSVSGTFSVQSNSDGTEGGLVKIILYRVFADTSTGYTQIGDDIEFTATSSLQNIPFTVTGNNPTNVNVVEQHLFVYVRLYFGSVQLLLDSVDVFSIATITLTDTDTQNGTGYDWEETGDFDKSVEFPVAAFQVDFLTAETADTISHTISIPASTTVSLDLDLFATESVVDLDITVGFFKNDVSVHSETNNITTGGAISINDSFNSGSGVDEVRLTIVNGGSALSVIVTNFDVSYVIGEDAINKVVISLQNSLGETISEQKTISVNCGCNENSLNLTWLNYLGGFDYWNFTAEKEHQVEVSDSQTIEENIFPQWPNSYGEFASTIEKQTYRTTKNSLLVRSQHLTEAQVIALKYIRTSPVVQIVNSQYDRRTVIVDKDSFKVYDEGEKLHEISFKVFYTDEIPSQSI